MSLYELGIVVQVCINVLLAMSVYVVFSTGQLTLGNAGFMAVGAYGAAVASTSGLPFPVTLLAAILPAAAAGLLIGFPALRVRGVYLAMATFAFGIVMESVFLVLPWTGGPRGISGIAPVSPGAVVAWTAAALALTYLLYRSNFWLRIRSVHDDEFAAALTGLNITVIKVAAFTVGGALAGLAGGLYAHWFSYVEPGAFTFQTSIFAVLYVIFGGRATFWGPVLGAIVLTLLPEMARGLDEWRSAFIGVVLLLLLVVRPSGILGRPVRFSRSLKRDTS